ncbi:putative Spotted leaf protein [Tripterygium wilfordii]|uniref:U-box domain-containing protein n=2 Tax=Tripterygium wilfordii TaxID=458696 RepID=A0A7J7DW39_TRIWF|nr:putative Spotted leaf protein [Tripterygium wilfordii]
MKDPVTTISSITYDRESIEHWLFTCNNTICPVTKQPLPEDSDLTPNHTLTRLIQSWCTIHGVDRIPTPKPILNKSHFLKLIKDLSQPHLQIKTLGQLELLASENERNRKSMVDAGVPTAMVSLVVTFFMRNQVGGLHEALSILHSIRIPSAESKLILREMDQIIESWTGVLTSNNLENNIAVKSHALSILKLLVEAGSSSMLERLKPEFFNAIVGVFREKKVTQQGTNAALNVLLHACQWGRNKGMMVKSGAVFELIELELDSPEKRTTELILGVLFHLCTCAEGRAEFVSNRGGIAVVAKRILRVSNTADDRAVLILSLVSKFCGTKFVVQEMLDAKDVSKLCALLQIGHCDAYLKEKAKEILRSNLDEWKKEPCFDASVLLTNSNFFFLEFPCQTISMYILTIDK